MNYYYCSFFLLADLRKLERDINVQLDELDLTQGLFLKLILIFYDTYF